MDTSKYFERTLFHDLSPNTAKYYTQSADFIFEKSPGRSKIEVRFQPSPDAPCHDKTKDIEKRSEEHITPNANTESSNLISTRFPGLPQEALAGDKQSLCTQTQFTSRPGSCDYHDPESDSARSACSQASSTALPAALDHHLGSHPPSYPGPSKLDTVSLNKENMEAFVKSTRHSFRVFYIRQRNSFSRIHITRDMFEQLLRSCHVFPRFNEYVIGLGLKSSDSEVTPPPLHYRPLQELRENRCHGFECGYLLRYAEHTNRPEKDPYSVRQFALYHRYKPRPSTGCSTWIIIGSSERTEKTIDEFNRSVDDIMASNPFELHVIFLSTAVSSWRPYLGDLKKNVRCQSDKALCVQVGDNNNGASFLSIKETDHQELKRIEDKITELILSLDSTIDIVETLEDMYEQYRQDCVPLQSAYQKSKYGNDLVLIGLKTEARKVAKTRKIAESLLSTVQSTKSLVSSLLERESAHNQQKLQIQGQEENAMMRKLAEKSSRDSSSMRVLTIITMIYLPCTIVSNFYSTQFVNQKELSTGGMNLDYAQNTYIFFAISIPLTLLTLTVWYAWVNSERVVQYLTSRTRGHDNTTTGVNERFQDRPSLAELPR